MGNTSSSQRGGKATQSQTVLRESTNANTPKDIPQAGNIAKDNLNSTNIEQDLKKDVVTPTESTNHGVVVPAIPSKVHTSTTNHTTKTVDQATITLSSAVGKVPDVGIPKLANVNPSETSPTLEAVTSQHIEESSNRALASNRSRERDASKRSNTRDPKIGARPEKRSRRVRGKGKSKGKGKGKIADDLQGDTENVPPSTTGQQTGHSRRRRGRDTGRVELGNGPPPRRGRATNELAVDAICMEDGKTAERSRKHGRSMSGIRRPGEATGRFPSFGDTRESESLQGVVSLEILALPKADMFHHANSADGRDSDGNYRRSITSPLSSSSPCEEKGFPNNPTDAGNVSSVQPLPSSTRRRAKEYFQRRTRERSVDAAGRHTRPSRRVQSATITGQSTLPNVLAEPRSQSDLNERVAKTSGNPSGTGRSASLSHAIHDRFVFDPMTSPFTPNATSSPRLASSSFTAAQSFSSPTPLPLHGSRKVTPLILPKPSNRSTRFTRSDSIPQLVPIASHGIQSTHGLAYAYTGMEQAQAHLQVEQMALMRLQAYYNWLAGASTPMAGVGIGVSACEHMDMSGGGGGLSGGVALGRQQGQNQGRGKGQCRNTSGAYAHPKEHVVFSPGDDEQADVASRSVLQRDGGQTGPVKPGMDETKKEPEGAAQWAIQKWDGKWGLREAAVAGTGKEIGWSWGTVGAKVRAS